MITAEQDPLAMPSGENTLSFPVLRPDKVYDFTIKSAELVDAKSDKAPEGGKNLFIVVQTAKDEMSTHEEVLHAGYTIRNYTTTYPTDKRPMKRVKDDLDLINQAVFGKKTNRSARDLINDPTAIVGKPVRAKVSIERDPSGQYGDRNTIRFIVPE